MLYASWLAAEGRFFWREVAAARCSVGSDVAAAQIALLTLSTDCFFLKECHVGVTSLLTVSVTVIEPVNFSEDLQARDLGLIVLKERLLGFA